MLCTNCLATRAGSTAHSGEIVSTVQLNDFSGYIIASPRGGPKPSEAPAAAKTFPLEGRKGDLFEAVESEL